jgi:hypothetical protein
MDPIINPYTPNAGSRPDELAGRDGQLSQFTTLVKRLKIGNPEQSMIVRGQRGVGKTVLLNAFEDIAEAEGFLCFYHELNNEMSLAEEVSNDLQIALLQLDLSAKALAKVKGALARLSAIQISYEGFAVSIDPGRADEGTLSKDLSELFVQVGKAAQSKGAGIILIFDEIQFAEITQYRAVITALHRAMQKNVPIAIAAAGLPQIPRLTGEARSYAERLFTFPEITKLGERDALDALVNPAARLNVKFDDDAIDVALEWTDGYPFYIQQLGKSAWNIAEGKTITKADVSRAVAPAVHALDNSIYEVRIQQTTDREKAYLRAMAELGAGPCRSGDIAKVLGTTTPKLSMIRQSLMDRGLIYATEDYGFVAYTVPRFDEFMIRRMELRSLDD